MWGLGTTLALIGVAYGWGTAAIVVHRLLRPGPRRRPAWSSVAAAALLVSSLLLPYADGRSRSTGRPVTLAGWDALDPLSLATLVAVAGAGVGVGRLLDDPASLLSAAALQRVLGLAAAAVLGGKWLVYTGYDHFGPAVPGFATAFAGAVAMVVLARVGGVGRGPASER